MTIIPAIIAYIDERLDESLPIKSGETQATDYPMILVDLLRDAERDGTQTTEETAEHEVYFQVTVATLDPADRTRIGSKVRNALRHRRDTLPIVWDEGEPEGRELTRYETDARRRSQRSEAPGAQTIYYYEVDVVMVIQTGGLD